MGSHRSLWGHSKSQNNLTAALFLEHDDMKHTVFQKRQIYVNTLKELPARDCRTKEAEITDKHRKNHLKKLPARDCKTKDGENIKTKEQKVNFPVHYGQVWGLIWTKLQEGIFWTKHLKLTK